LSLPIATNLIYSFTYPNSDDDDDDDDDGDDVLHVQKAFYPKNSCHPFCTVLFYAAKQLIGYENTNLLAASLIALLDKPVGPPKVDFFSTTATLAPREREGERETERGRQREIERYRKINRDREKEIERDIELETASDRGGEKRENRETKRTVF
jgi:hypothetical protein